MTGYTLNKGVITFSDGTPVTTTKGDAVTGKYTDDKLNIVGDDGKNYPAKIPPKGSGNDSSTGDPRDNHLKMQKHLGGGTRTTSPLNVLGGFSYRKGTVSFNYGDLKHGVMPKVGDFLLDLAVEIGVDATNNDLMSAMLRGVVADLFVNGASDKRDFSGTITVDGGFVTIEQFILRATMEKYVGSQYRRVARAMAPIIVEVLTLDAKMFEGLIQARAKQFSVSIEDAKYLFDGADALISIPSHLAHMNVESKMVRLSHADLSSNLALHSNQVKYGKTYQESIERASNVEL